MKLPGIVILFFALLISCSDLGKSGNKEAPVARVGDKYLYHSDLEGVGKGAVRAEDSIQAVRNYVDSWIRHNLLLRYAEDNLPEEAKNLDLQLRDYKESLLIYMYEKELLNDKLDTSVTREEILAYYQDHKETFELKTGIIR